MSVMFTVIVLAFVVAVLAFVAFALVAPFAHHAESYRDPRTGRRRWDSPHLD